MFNPVSYFTDLASKLKLTKDTYTVSLISGITELEEVLANRKRKSNFIAIDINEDGTTIQGEGRGYFERRPYTIFLCSYAGNSLTDRHNKLAELRSIYRSFITKIIKDRSTNQLLLINTKRIPFYELPGSFADGFVGIYFILTVDNQINLVYDPTEWI